MRYAYLIDSDGALETATDVLDLAINQPIPNDQMS
jgi:hypothetical protein